MGVALLVFLLVLEADNISQQDISSEDVNTMLDRLIKQTKQDNDTSISIEMNRETFLQQEVVESSNDSDIYYLKTFNPRLNYKSSSEIFDDLTELKNITSNENGTFKYSANYDPILEDKISRGVARNISVVTENGLKENVEDDKNILKSLFEKPDDKVTSLEDSTLNNITELNTVENNLDQPNRELDLFKEYPESRKSNNKEESNQLLDQIIKDLKDTIEIDNIIKAATIGQKTTTAAMLLNEFNDGNQETDNLAPLNYAPEPLKAVYDSFNPRKDIFTELLEDIFRNKPKNDPVVNEMLPTFGDSISRSSNILLEKVFQGANSVEPTYILPYRHTSIAPTLTSRFIVPNYQPNFRRSIVNHPVSYMNEPLVYPTWRQTHLAASPLKFSPIDKFKHSYFTSGLIDKLTTRPILKPLNYNAFYK